jgi:hypothetical protein
MCVPMSVGEFRKSEMEWHHLVSTVFHEQIHTSVLEFSFNHPRERAATRKYWIHRIFGRGRVQHDDDVITNTWVSSLWKNPEQG